MGRAERRRAERIDRIENKKTQVTLSRAELNQIKQDISNRASAYGTESLMTCFALAQHRLYGFGYKRIFRTLEYIDELMSDILSGEKDMDEYIEELKDETGIVITCDR